MKYLSLLNFQDIMGSHKALRTFDVLECIFSFLDQESLENICNTCSFWKAAVVQSSLWKKLANNFAAKTVENFTILKQKGLDKRFDEDKFEEESEHFQKLCHDFVHFKRDWKTIEPTETLLCCAPEDVNKNFNFKWNPWWQWKNQGGWIASFTFDKKFLLCGVIETLQLWDLSSNECVSILETPRDDIIVGVDIALNCLDLLDATAVSGSNEGIIRVWDIRTSKYCKRLDCSEYGAVNALKLFKDSLLSGHDDGQLVIWLVKSPDQILPLSTLVHHTDIIWGLDISNQFVVSCSEDKSLAVYLHSDIFPKVSVKNLPNSKENLSIPGHLANRLVGHTAAVTCVSVTAGLVLSGSRDRTVRVWQVGSSDYTVLNVLLGHTELVHYVTQDQDRIFSSDDKGELLVWDKKKVVDRGDHVYDNQFLVKRFDYGERGAIDCIKVLGTKVFTSYDDFGNIAINDFW